MKKFLFISLCCMSICSYVIYIMWIEGFFDSRKWKWSTGYSSNKFQIPITASSGALEFLAKAKNQIWVVKSYDRTNGYYGNGGFPPDDTWVCTDVIWRAYRDMGYDFKKLFTEDIQKSPELYLSQWDSNIAFRRVKNLYTYFSHTAKSLTTELIPNDTKNLTEWQPGDIVIFDELPSSHLWHIGVIADIRNNEWVPYIIDNHGEWVNISITPLDWPTRIIWHYRHF